MDAIEFQRSQAHFTFGVVPLAGRRTIRITDCHSQRMVEGKDRWACVGDDRLLPVIDRSIGQSHARYWG
jgi:hypothetical protein